MIRLSFFLALFIIVVFRNDICTANTSLVDPKIIFNFQGRGTDLAWGLGAARAMTAKVPVVLNGQTIFAGNSSGAVLAAYFSCHGFSKESVEELMRRLVMTDPSFVNEDLIQKFLAISSGSRTEFPMKNLDQWIAVSLSANFDNLLPEIMKQTRDPSQMESFEFPSAELCAPNYPVVITAANNWVLDTKPKTKLGLILAAKRIIQRIPPVHFKEFDERNFSVSWKKEKFAEMVKSDPSLKSPYIGKACTYFVSRHVFDIMVKIPYGERLCDLRLIQNGNDLRLAIRASSAEPTYFDPVKETEVEKVYPSDVNAEASTSIRDYSGGFMLPTVVQDIRRVIPDLYALGTGWTPLTGNVQGLLREWQLIDVFQTSQITEWWLDLSLIPPKALEDEMLENRSKPLLVRIENLIRFAKESQRFAIACIESGKCHPQFVKKPHFTKTLESSEELVTRRGLGPLVQ